MKHLSREELIDSLDGTLPAARQAHMDGCANCRQERASLQQVLQRVTSVEVPEPSPLFWEHFSARLQDAVERQPQPSISTGWGAWAWQGWTWRGWAVGMATMLVCVTLAWSGWRNARHIRVAGAPTRVEASDPSLAQGLSSGLSEEDWNLVVSMAEDVTVDDADEPGLAVRPGASDRALTDLSSEQRTELARLLTAEMARPAS
jgi:hypothetical protein